MPSVIRKSPPESKEAVVDKYTVLVKRIAHHLKAYLPSNVQVDDLVQAGMVGLLDAAEHFNNKKGASFETYAGIRIRGSMIDEVRKGDWAPRSVHRKAREVAKAAHDVQNRKGRDAHSSEIAEELGISLDEYFHIIADSKICQICDFDEPRVSNGGMSPYRLSSFILGPSEKVEKDSSHDMVKEQVAMLSKRERLVIALYYNEEMNLKNIGKLLGVSESRVSQIHSQAVERLKALNA